MRITFCRLCSEDVEDDADLLVRMYSTVNDLEDDGETLVRKSTPFCASCRLDRAWCKATMGMSLSEQMVMAAHEGDAKRVEKLLNKGAPVSGMEAALERVLASSSDNRCKLRITPLAAACIECDSRCNDRRDIIHKLFNWSADSHSAVVCETHGEEGFSIPDGCLHGKAPIDLARLHDAEHGEPCLCPAMVIRTTRGRERRATPVIERAAKAGVKLDPTPAGVRDTIKSGTPNAQKLATRSLQRHQKACQQKVARAEERDPSHPRADKRPRILAKHAVTQARHHKQKKETEKETVNAEEERRILE
jgi:hypothetical protein